jgi:L-fuculose-phosphate aldolase
MDLAGSRAALHDTLIEMASAGLVIGSAGNASMRIDDATLLVSAGGVPYDQLTPDDHPLVSLVDGTSRDGAAPTSELALHLALHRAQGLAPFDAVVHTHSPHAAGYAVARVDLEFVCNENLGPCADRVLVTDPYAPPGSGELAEHTVATLRRQPGSRACLLANHGPVSLGIGLRHALLVAKQVEWIATISHVAAAVGRVHVIERHHQDQMAATYGYTIARERPA